jgi:DNA repair photolyase
LTKPAVVFGTKEWASYNENFVNGCAHDCLYCYSKEMAIRFKRKSALTWKNETINKNKLNAPAKSFAGRVMFPSSHDITPNNLDKTIIFLEKLLSFGNDILVVSKPHYECIKCICQKFEPYKKQLLFRFTIGSPDSGTLRFWEPFAPSFSERFKSLKHVYERGFKTSLSIEPMLDRREHIELLVEKCIPHITDAIWIGKPNS